MESQLLEKRELHRWLRKMQCGGRSAFARALDYVTLRALLFIAAYLVFGTKFAARTTALLLSTIALSLCMLVLRMYREISFERFRIKELARIRNLLLSDRLMLLEIQRMLPLVSVLCPLGETPVVLQRARPVDANAVLAVVRTHRDAGHLHVFSCTPYAADAIALAARMSDRVTLHAPEELLRAARADGLTPEEGEVHAFIRAQMRRSKPIGNHYIPSILQGGARKYACIALLFLGLSFLTEYALYYRLLAGLCMSIAAVGGAMRQRGRTI